MVGSSEIDVGVQRRFWRAVRGGLGIEDASRVAGVSHSCARLWFVKAGGVIPSIVDEPSGARLSFREREEIAHRRQAGTSIRAIARELRRAPSTVSRELRRPCVAKIAGYRASTAQSHAQKLARRPKQAKLATYLPLRREVEARLKLHHSPEQIARRLVVDFPDDPAMRVSAETIYQSLYIQSRGGLKRELTAHLRTGRTLRKPHRTATERRGRIPGMVNISERPAEVADRAVPGHWEGDLIIGTKNSAIATLVERTTRFTMLVHLPGRHTADIVAEALIAKITELPDLLRRSLTWDQGSELSRHAHISTAADIDIYFCDPHSPWQRGTNENTNGLLRQYFPKSTDLGFYGPGYLDNIAAELNGRPRETLRWQTPTEALKKLLSPPTQDGVALTG